MKKQTRNLLIIVGAAVVLTGVLLAVIFLLPSSTSSTTTASTYPTDANGHEYAVDEKGNRIEAETMPNGKIAEAGVVNLTDKVPADLKTVTIVNSSGEFTVNAETKMSETTTASDGTSSETAAEATVYTLAGYENYTLDSTAVNGIGNDAAAIASTKIVDINGENPEDYGFSNPRAVATITYNDGSTAVVKVGNQAPIVDSGTYVMVDDDKAIYLVDNESVDGFLYNIAQLMDKNITSAAANDSDAAFSTLTISGSKFDKPIVLEPNDDETNSAYYKITSPITMPASVEEASSITGCVRGLLATSVEAVNPTDDQLAEFGLAEPYATAEGVYPDTTYVLKASSPDSDGNVYLMNDTSKLVYKIAASKVTWVSTSLEKLEYEYILKPKTDKLSSVDVTYDGKTYSFTTEQKTSTDDDGNETTSTAATYDGEELNSSYFDNYISALTSVTRGGTESVSAGDEVLKVTYNYNNGKSSDTAVYYASDTTKVAVKVNGTDYGYVYDSYVSQTKTNTEKIAANEKV